MIWLVALVATLSHASAGAGNAEEASGWWCTGNATFRIATAASVQSSANASDTKVRDGFTSSQADSSDSWPNLRIPNGKIRAGRLAGAGHAAAMQGTPCRCPVGCYACTGAGECRACMPGWLLLASFGEETLPPRCLSPSACTAAGGTPSSLRHVPDQTPDAPVDGSKGLALPALFRTCTLPPLRTATINIVGLDDPQPPATTAPNTTAATLSQPPQLHSRQGRAATAKRICTESQLPTADVIIMLDTTSSLLSSTGCQTVPQLKIGLKKFVSSLVSHQCITSSSSSLAFSPPPASALITSVVCECVPPLG